MRRHFPFFSMMLMVVFISCETETNSKADAASGRQINYTGTLSFLDSSGSILTSIDIAVADTEELRSLGLMDVRNLKQDGGMLFIFPEEERRSFWMANTPLPLDLIFVNNNLEIVHVHQNARPFSQQSIDSVYPALYVIEVNAGFTVSNDLQPGQLVSFEY